jgi:hypothetical protein
MSAADTEELKQTFVPLEEFLVEHHYQTEHTEHSLSSFIVENLRVGKRPIGAKSGHGIVYEGFVLNGLKVVLKMPNSFEDERDLNNEWQFYSTYHHTFILTYYGNIKCRKTQRRIFINSRARQRRPE